MFNELIFKIKDNIIDYIQINEIYIAVLTNSKSLVVDQFNCQINYSIDLINQLQRSLNLFPNFDIDSLPMAVIESGNKLELLDIIGSGA